MNEHSNVTTLVCAYAVYNYPRYNTCMYSIMLYNNLPIMTFKITTLSH